MRHLGDSSAGPPGRQSRDPGARARGAGTRGAGTRGAPGGSTRGAHGGARGAHGGAGRRADAATKGGDDGDQSVFEPGYRSQRPRREAGHSAAGPGGPDAGWPGAAADGTVGKGPVRGFPPAPGQPPPLYPPGQFAAWNRRSAAREAREARAGGRPGAALGSGGAAGARAGSGTAGQPGQPWPADGPGGQAYEPGYSALAVSDPAADVTSTQTWQAIGDGPDGPDDAGTWTDRRDSAVPAPTAGRPAGGADWPAATAEFVGASATGVQTTDTGTTATEAAGSRAGSRAAGSRAAGSRAAGSRAAGSRAAGSRASGSRSGRSAPKGGSSRKGRRSLKPVLAVCAVMVLALAAGTFLLLTARHQGTAAAGGPAPTPTARTSTPTPTPGPTLGQFGHIASRTADPLPLTITQLFPRSFTIGSASAVRTISQVSKSCTAAVIGTGLQTAVQAAKCTQVVRATYLSTAEKEMGTIGVLNLSSATAAEHAGRSAGASGFIAQLPARRGVTHQLGKGTGIEEAEAKGHYLILIWAQFTSGAKPKTSAQSQQLEAFMSDLFQQTANISLSSRMVDGTPG